MKIACISDLHNYLPEVPTCDLLLLGGDYTSERPHNQYGWFQTYFRPWVEQASKKCRVVGVGGNHDILFQKDHEWPLSLPWKYLRDSGIEIDGLKIWGNPWTKHYGMGWAFNLTEEQLEFRWSLIPDDTDIVITHGPAYGIGDYSTEHCGSPSLVERLNIVRPKLVVYGHIHEGYGTRVVGGITYVNAALMDVKYKPVNPIQIIEL